MNKSFFIFANYCQSRQQTMSIIKVDECFLLKEDFSFQRFTALLDFVWT